MSALLAASDQAYLDEVFPEHHVEVAERMICVVLADFALPAGLEPRASDLLVRLPAGFPDQAPDMFWLAETVARSDRQSIPATQVVETHLGRRWVRWSRHLAPGEWGTGTDDLRSYLAYVRRCLATAAPKAA